jgi:hypothetical protein
MRQVLEGSISSPHGLIRGGEFKKATSSPSADFQVGGPVPSPIKGEAWPDTSMSPRQALLRPVAPFPAESMDGDAANVGTSFSNRKG